MDINPDQSIRIIEWINARDKKEHTLKSTIYQDDNIVAAMNKINAEINSNDDLYVWSGDTPLEFNISTSWQGYNANPFLAYQGDIPLNEEITYNMKHNLVNLREINIAFRSNVLKDMQPYYFPFKRNISNIPSEDTLKRLKDTKPKNVFLQNISKYLLKGTLTNNDIPSMKLIFKTTTLKRDCIIWIRDNNHILYRLKKKHNLQLKLLQKINNDEFQEECIIVLYGITKNSYCKLIIGSSGNISIDFALNLRDRINWARIDEQLDTMHGDIVSLTGSDAVFVEDMIRTSIQFQMNEFSTTETIKRMIKMPLVFVGKNKLNNTIIYKRTSIDTTTEINEDIFIRNLLKRNLSKEDIANELLNLLPKSLTKEEILTRIDMIIENSSIINLHKIKQIGTLLTLNHNSENKILTIVIDDIPNRMELGYAIFWIQRMLNFKKEQPKQQQPPIQQQKEVKRKIIRKKDDNSGSSSGGGNTGNSSQITLLQAADKDLFSDGYSVKCQVRQPMVMTVDRFNSENIQEHVDNHITYGSKPTIQNVYFCPRWWCPNSMTPRLDDKSCPDGEQAVNLYVKNKTKIRDPTIPKYVGLIPNANKPCCFVNLKKENEVRVQGQSNDNSSQPSDNTYVLTNPEPAAEGRIGTVTKELFFLLKNTVETYENCTGNLRKSPCWYRYGVNNPDITNSSNLMRSILKCLNLNTFNDFMRHVKSKIRFMQYISLENGFICKEFMKRLNERYQFMDKWFPENINIPYFIKKNIYGSFIKFINYLNSNNDNISPHILYSLIAVVFNRILIVFSYQDGKTTIQCPEFSSLHNLKANIKGEPKCIFILQNEGRFEPLVFKSKDFERFEHDLDAFERIESVLGMCDMSTNFDETFNNLFSFHFWIKSTRIANNKNYYMHKILVNSNMSISHIMLKNGIALKFPNIPSSYISKLLNSFQIDEIGLYDATTFNQEIDINRAILKKVHEFSLELVNTNEMVIYQDAVMFYNQQDNEILERIKRQKGRTKVFDKVIQRVHQDIMDKKIDFTDPNWINKYLDSVNENKAQYRIILEEIDRDNIKSWYESIDIKKDFMNNKVIDKDDYYVFSGVALIRDIPQELRNSYISFKDTMINKEYDLNSTTNSKQSFRFADIDMIDRSNRFLRLPLPTKWREYRGYFATLNYIKNTDYNNDSLYKLFNELIKMLKLKVSIDDIKESRDRLLYIALSNRQLIDTLLSETHIRLQITKALGTSTKKIQEIGDKLFSLETTQKQNIYNALKNKLPPISLDVVAASRLLNMTFVVIRRRALHTGEDYKRNSIQDLMKSLDVYIPEKSDIDEWPCIVLFLDTNLYLVTDGENIIYERLSKAPEELKLLILAKQGSMS